ncbi:MAG: nitrile hydratase subunit beta [Proteobacteria bacterium]|nr:nitrile hydratase subunit beta [Pseudomonadota bacterium]
MNGGQDLGGVHGFGPVHAEADEPVFHAPWERRAFAMTLALGMLGRWNIDMSRHYRENRSPLEYLGASYYQLWFDALERLAVDRGLITEAELQAGRALAPRDPALRVPDAPTARRLLADMKGAKVDAKVAPRFSVGVQVRVSTAQPRTHTRMPRYCRGKVGVIQSDHGAYVFPDTHAHDLGQKPQHLYSVRFSALELWGAARNDAVHIDLWDDYLAAA